MIKFRIDKTVKDTTGTVIYLHVYDDKTNNILATPSFVWKDKEDFKEKVRVKIAKLTLEYKEKEEKEIEVTQALLELEEEEKL